MIAIAISTAILLTLLVALSFVIWSALARRTVLPVDAEWIDDLSIERYRPMMRLLDPAEMAFLKSQPGFTSEMGARLRTQRSLIFLGYLRCLRNDFDRVCTAVKILMMQSRHDRPDLAAVLVRQQAEFALAMAVVRLRLFLFGWGICSVDVDGLVNTFDALRVELRSLVPVSVGAPA